MPNFENDTIDLERVSDRDLWNEFRRRGFTNTANVDIPVSLSEMAQRRYPRDVVEADIKSRAIHEMAAFLIHDGGLDRTTFEDGPDRVVNRFSITVVKFPEKQ